MDLRALGDLSRYAMDGLGSPTHANGILESEIKQDIAARGK